MYDVIPSWCCWVDTILQKTNNALHLHVYDSGWWPSFTFIIIISSQFNFISLILLLLSWYFICMLGLYRSHTDAYRRHIMVDHSRSGFGFGFWIYFLLSFLLSLQSKIEREYLYFIKHDIMTRTYSSAVQVQKYKSKSKNNISTINN